MTINSKDDACVFLKYEDQRRCIVTKYAVFFSFPLLQCQSLPLHFNIITVIRQIPAAGVKRGTNVSIIRVFLCWDYLRVPLGIVVTDDTTTTQHKSDEELRAALPTLPLTRIPQSTLIVLYDTLLDHTALY